MTFTMNESLGFILHRTNLKLKNQFHHRLKAYDITPEQWGLLGRLWEKDGITQRELSTLSCKDQPTTARILDKLEKKGLLRRTPNPVDRRTSLIVLTEQGWELKDKLIPIAEKTLHKAMVGFSNEEIEQLKIWLNNIYYNLE